MGRPPKFDRQAAVEVAMHEIWKNGLEASSAKALSERLGITRSSFYNAFGSREALFKEALDLYFRQAPDRVLAHVGADASVLAVLTRMFRDVCRVRAADPEAKGCMAINCVAELVGVDATLGPVMEGAVRDRLDRLETLLRQAAANGEIRDAGDLKQKALALQNLLMGLNVLSKVVRSEEQLWSGVELALKGLGLFRPEGAPRPRSRHSSRKATSRAKAAVEF
jgi:TetR/AcrR family transcriptional regulator, transcriptional repressor for nem operon